MSLQFSAQSTLGKVAERRTCVVARAEKQEVNRRTALSLAGLALLSASQPSEAKRVADIDLPVFGKDNKTVLKFIPYEGKGFELQIPAEWEPSKEVETDGQLLRYEDHFDAVTNLVIYKIPTSKGSITDYSLEGFLGEQSRKLFGVQAFSGATDAEGGFKSGKVSAVSLMETDQGQMKNGKPYYFYEVLCRTADGDEGGRHSYIKATIKDGSLVVIKCQAGDKRWIRGQRKNCLSAVQSFQLV